jgi:hypothetical protein
MREKKTWRKSIN